MDQKLVIIILVGVIVGMVLAVPTIFMSDILIGGILVGLLAGVIGYFSMKRKAED